MRFNPFTYISPTMPMSNTNSIWAAYGIRSAPEQRISPDEGVELDTFARSPRISPLDKN